MKTPIADTTLPLDEVMLAMDVVDTLRHRQDMVVRELDGAAREKQLIEKLREIYHQQGIDVPDHILKEGVAALNESRFVYTPAAGGLGAMLARLYVTRKRWDRWVGGIFLAMVIGIAGHQFAYVPFENSRIEAARAELTDVLPARMDALYNSIYEETKIQAAAMRAAEIQTRGKTAASEGDRLGAEAAIASLREIRDTIRRDYTLRIVSGQGVQSGFWTFPEINTDATNYYIVVEAIDAEGRTLNLPILSEESGNTEIVSLWGLRVSQDIYASVERDKRDDGIIQRSVIGRKPYGYLDINYIVPVLGGAVTRW